MEQNTIINKTQAVLQEVGKAVVGKDEVLLWAFAAVLAGGHILMEDIPGVGKTTMALAFSKALGLGYNRVQFNPDVLPSDVTGYSIPDASGAMTYKKGAVMCNLFLADELNRATSRTQSALLEAMEEGQVTVDGVSHRLPRPFMVLATQNPVGAAGTQLLPDSQLDRFTLRLSLGYPDPKNEAKMARQRQGKNPMDAVCQVLTPEELTALQQQVADTYVSDIVIDYTVALVNKTRCDSRLLQGASPRATLAVLGVAKAVAQLRGRNYVLPRDVQEVLIPAVAHRLILSHTAKNQGDTPNRILEDILKNVPAPKLQ